MAETGKFIGCILSVKTKPGPHGEVKNIVGTVKDIDVGSDEQAIILDDAMSNGLILPDGYRLKSSQIADLTVIGRTDGCVDDDERATGAPISSVHSHRNLSMVTSASLQTKKLASHVPIQHNNIYLSSSASEEEDQQQLNQVNISLSNPKMVKLSNVAKTQVGGNGGVVPGGNVLLNSLTSATASFNQQEQQKTPKIAKPKARKPQQSGQTLQGQSQSTVAGSVHVVYSSSSLPPGHNRQNNAPKTTSEPFVNVQNYSVATKENILTQTFGPLISSTTTTKTQGASGVSSGGSVPLNGASLFNTLASAAAAVSSTGGQIIVNELKSSAIDKKTHQQQLGGVLNQLVQRGVDANGGTKQSKNMNHATPFEVKSPRGKTNSFNTKGAKTNETNGDTFAMSKTDMSDDFDFEGSNAHFVKLPVAPKKDAPAQPVPLARNGSRPTDPLFTSEDTTLVAERMVESVTLRGTGVVASKRFVTDTGIAIPAVDVSKRSMILNLAHDVGLDHSRMIETMARAVVQTCLPIFGDAYRLSPEREEDRPWILICAGPHWQGAVGTAAARVMASLGVRTVVHSPKEELTVCAREEKLYGLTGESFTRRLSDIGNRRFELVIMALDDHLSTSLTLKPFSRWLNNTSVMFVDPPMVSSYKDSLEQVLGKGNVGSKVGVVCPALPLAYGIEPSVKFYLVNLGIPQGVYLKNDILYKSPFGDKLVVQIFSLKQAKTKQNKEASP